MRFLAPAFLSAAWLLPVAVALYLFRPRPRTVPVSTLLFFKSIAREHQESAWLRRLKRLLSFLLTAGVIGAATLAMAHPVLTPPEGAVSGVVILVDRSASMAARRPDGRTALAIALARVRARLAGLPGGAGVLVIAFDRRPEILLSRTLDRREVERALDSIAVRPIEGDSQTALALAARLAAIDRPASIWLASDAPADAPEGATVEWLGAVDPAPVNAGITAFALRRLPLEHARYEAFVQIHAVAPAPLDAELEIRVDGALLGVRRMTIPSGSRERLLLPVEAGEGKTLSLRIAAHGDVLPLDDTLHARIPEARPIRVAWITPAPDPFTELALASLGSEGDAQIFQAGPDAWPPKEPVDVAILDGWLPDSWPADGAVVVIDPPRSLGPIQASRLAGDGLPLDAVRVTEERHPILYGVASGRIAPTQTVVLPADGALDPLWVGPSGPLLLAGEIKGRRIVVMGFAPGRSERLPLMASFPLLLGNALYWAAEPRVQQQSDLHHATGDLVTAKGGAVTWSIPGASDESFSLQGGQLELDHVGLWRTDAGEAGSASVLSQRETCFAATAPVDAPAEAAAGTFSGELVPLLTAAVAALLLIESWLFHRHGVY